MAMPACRYGGMLRRVANALSASEAVKDVLNQYIWQFARGLQTGLPC